MSRQRLQPSLGDANHVTCPRCDGQGTIRSIESLALSLLRVIDEESMKPQTAQLRLQIPVEVATYLMNEKRQDTQDLEQRHGVQILIIPNQNFTTPHYEVQRVKADEIGNTAKNASFTLIKPVESEPEQHRLTHIHQHPENEPAIQAIHPSMPAPQPKPVIKESGLIRRLWGAMFGSNTPSKDTEATSSSRNQKSERHSHKRSTDTSDNKRQEDRSPRRSHQGGSGGRKRPQNRRGSGQRTQGQRRPHQSNRSQQRGRPQRNKPDTQQRSDQNDHSENHTQNMRKASDEERTMHHQQKQAEMARPAPEAQKVNQQENKPAHSENRNAPKKINKEQPKSEQKPVQKEHKAPQKEASHESSKPVSSKKVDTPEKPTSGKVEPKKVQETAKHDPRRDKIGFIKLSPEEAQNTVVQHAKSSDTSTEKPKLQQVVTKRTKEDHSANNDASQASESKEKTE